MYTNRRENKHIPIGLLSISSQLSSEAASSLELGELPSHLHCTGRAENKNFLWVLTWRTDHNCFLHEVKVCVTVLDKQQSVHSTEWILRLPDKANTHNIESVYGCVIPGSNNTAFFRRTTITHPSKGCHASTTNTMVMTVTTTINQSMTITMTINNNYNTVVIIYQRLKHRMLNKLI